METPLYVIHCFSLGVLIFFSLCLIFVSLINMWLGAFLLGFILYGTIWASWTWMAISFHILEKNFNYYFCIYFLMPFLFVFFFWDSYLTLSQRPLSLICFYSFFFFCILCFCFFHLSIFQLTYYLSASVTLLLVPSRVFLISTIALFIADWLFFISSRSLLCTYGIV